MPINLPGIPIQPVPVGQVPGVIPQIPPHVDPSSIIMQAAQLHQQNQIAQQELQQKSIDSMTQALQGAATLQEHTREAKMNEAQAQSVLALKQQLQPAEIQHMQAQTALANAQAKMLTGDGNAPSTFLKIHNGETPPSVGFGAYSTRNGMQASMRNLYFTLYPNDNESQLEAAYHEKLARASLAGGGKVQIPQALTQSLIGITSKLADQAEDLGLTKSPWYNHLRINYVEQAGSKEEQQLLGAYKLSRSEGIAQLATVFANGDKATDIELQRAEKALPLEASPDSIRGAAQNALPDLAALKIGAFQSISPQSQNPSPRKKSTVNFDDLYKKHGLQ